MCFLFRKEMALIDEHQLKDVVYTLNQKDEMLQHFVSSQITKSFPQEFIYEGHQFMLLQDVFHKGGRERPSDCVPHLPVWEQTRILEVGCGNGCMSSAYYLRHHSKVDHVTALDINPTAVNNTRINFQRHHVPGDVRQSDLFAEVKGQLFDLIFWNPPWQSASFNTENEMIELALTDPGYKVLYRYMSEVRRYLSERGRAFICMGLEISDMHLLNDLATKAGCRLDTTAKGKMKGLNETCDREITWALLEIVHL